MSFLFEVETKFEPLIIVLGKRNEDFFKVAFYKSPRSVINYFIHKYKSSVR